MAWTTPRTWVTGELVTSAVMNAHVRDNLNYLYSTTGELGYNEQATPLTVTAGTEATAQTFISAPAITFDGTTTVVVECFVPDASNSGGGTLHLTLFDGGTSIGDLSVTSEAATVIVGKLERELTPASGSRTYSLRAWRGTANWTLNVGAGGAGVRMPGFIRVKRTS